VEDENGRLRHEKTGRWYCEPRHHATPRLGIDLAILNDLFPESEFKEKITYRLASGEAIYGEYDYVEQLEYFEGMESVEVIKDTWVLKASESVILNPREDNDEEDDESV
jgi:hypothetical protein